MTQIKIALLLCFFIKVSDGQDQRPCIPQSHGLSSIVCVCNSTYCDNIPQPLIIPQGEYLSYTSSESGLRFKIDKGEFQSNSTLSSSDLTTINLDTSKRYQTIIGWGGAFTDATGFNINALSSATADYLLKSYFSEDGLEYNLCRVPIGGTDFSTHAYSYDDGIEDPQLVNFKLAPADYIYKIPLIKAAMNFTNGTLELIASAWTAPKWMKTKGNDTEPNILKESSYQVWANYHIKFLEAYKAEGIDFWGITTGSEPSTGLMAKEVHSLGWHSWQMGKWVAENVGPTIRNSKFSSLKILTVDDQASHYPSYIDTMFENAKAKEYIDGFGLHWYWNNLFPTNHMSVTHNKYPDKFILATEASAGSEMFDEHVLLGDWKRAEAYAKDIINDLNNWVTGWIDWNMALDLIGGPSYTQNFVDSPIIVNVRSGEFYKQPMYYAIGHFAKFIPKESERVSVILSDEKVDVVAFCKPDNGTTVVVLNRNTYEVPIKLTDTTNGEITKIIPPKSIITFLY